ncbi:hypothetical protein HYU95_01175 [Candidatus Daviesbacteria bacterium]|nr:hypothetical protein [Candidatus Daviesbacteria bacterium]
MSYLELFVELRNYSIHTEQAAAQERVWWQDCIKAQAMVLSDRPTKPVDAALFFGRAWHDAEKTGVYQLMVDFYNKGWVKNVAVYGNEGQKFGEKDPAMLEPNNLFPKERRKKMVGPAREIARARLIRMGIPDEHIILTQIPDPSVNNTLAESMGFFITAKDQGWESAVVIANPHQLLREMLGLVQIMDKEPEYCLNIYSAAPTSTDWKRRVRGAQGEHFAPREEHIALETNRIRTYQQTGDLASFDRYFEYIIKRNKTLGVNTFLPRR